MAPGSEVKKERHCFGLFLDRGGSWRKGRRKGLRLVTKSRKPPLVLNGQNTADAKFWYGKKKRGKNVCIGGVKFYKRMLINLGHKLSTLTQRPYVSRQQVERGGLTRTERPYSVGKHYNVYTTNLESREGFTRKSRLKKKNP